MLLKFVEKIGDKTITLFREFYLALEFSILCLLHMINPRSYNSTMQRSLVHQIYHTSITILPTFTLIAFLFGSIVIGTIISIATKYNLQIQIGSIIVNFVINEFSPIFTALFISLRSGTLINKKLAFIDFENEVDLIDNIVLPRIISGILSTLTLSILFSIIMIVSAYIFISLFMGIDFHSYKQLLFNAFEINNIVILFFKSIAFGFVVMLIPIYHGLRIAQNNLAKRISLINTLVKLFFAIFFIEVFSLLLLALFNI